MTHLLAIITLVCYLLVTRGPTLGEIFLLYIFTMKHDAVILAIMNFLNFNPIGQTIFLASNVDRGI
jgi:hypothetical protein